MKLYEELKRRNVFKVGIAYVVVAWVVLQVADVILGNVDLPGWIFRTLLLLLALGFPIALVLAWAFELTRDGLKRDSAMGEGDVDIAPARSNHETSIAVLPFPDMSAEKDQEHFCDGLTEELLNVFTSIPNLRVASRTSCFAFKGQELDLPAVAAKLSVGHILEGSVRKSGNTIRVTAQLIDTATDSHVWSETYDRELNDIFAIQDDIAAKILEELKVTLGTKKLPDATTHNAKAYEYYLRGRGYAMTNGRQDNKKAIELFEKATATDPRFLRAWSGLAEAYARFANFDGGGEAAAEAAKRASEKASAIQPDHVRSHLARAYAHLACHKFPEARQDFQKVIELSPKNFAAHHHLGRLEQHSGNPAESIRFFRKAMELNPEDYESPLLAIGSYKLIGDEENMRRYAQLGIDRARQHIADYPNNPRPYYLGTSAFLILDRAEEAKEWAEAALDISPDDSTTLYNLACYYALTGESERSLDLLENSIQSRSWIETDPELESLRDHPRYKALIATLPQ